jgi:hypothetical protein
MSESISNACASVGVVSDRSADRDQPIGPLDESVCLYDHSECPTIRDIYRRAFEAVSKLRESGLGLDSIEANSVSVAKVLTPFLEELDIESQRHGEKIDFNVARKLDEQFFGTRHSAHWHKAFQNPEIGHLLQSSDFTYPVPDCGFVVKDHGLLTMTIALNIPAVLSAYEKRRTLEQEHDEFHKALGVTECADNDVCDEFVAQLRDLDSKIDVSYVYYSDENESDYGNDFDADADDESE